MASSTHSPALERLLARHREEAKRLKEQLGDPDEALGQVVRESFDADSLAEAYRELTEGGSVWDDDWTYSEPFS
jgi:hypothetical protein